MAYVKNTWNTGDVITADKLNNMEDGIAAAASGLETKQNTLIAGDNITIENNVISASISDPEPEIPIDYRILEYAQSDGAAWIDTGVTINGAYTLKEELSVPQGKPCAAMVAHYDQDMRQGFMVFNTASHKIARFWPSVAYADIPVNSNINLGNKFSVIQNRSSITVIQDSYSTTVTYDGGTGTDTKTIHLLHSDNPNHESYMNGTLYSAQILNSSDCILNMVPVQRKSDNVVGMFDKVSKTFFDSDGTGVFLAGPIVDENTGEPDLSTKMDKTNPTGTGMFSLNRKVGSLTGDYSFAEGMDTTASGKYSHAEGFATIAAGDCQHVSGKNNVEDSAGEYAIIVGNGNASDKRSNAFAMKWDGTFVLPDADSADKKLEITPAEFKEMKNGGGGSSLIRQGVDGNGNPVEGATVIGNEANVASGKYSHAEGSETTASNEASHAEGDCASAYGICSHAEGHDTNTYGYASHAEGHNTGAHGEYSHAEGNGTNASGKSSHAEGYYTKTSGDYSHAEGQYTIAARKYQHVSGKYNIADTNSEYLVIVGNGTGDTSRSNALAIKDDGSLVFAGGVTFTPADLQALYNLIHPTT